MFHFFIACHHEGMTAISSFGLEFGDPYLPKSSPMVTSEPGIPTFSPASACWAPQMALGMASFQSNQVGIKNEYAKCGNNVGLIGNVLEVLISKSPSFMAIRLFCRFCFRCFSLAIEANIPNSTHEHIGPLAVEAILAYLVMCLSFCCSLW